MNLQFAILRESRVKWLAYCLLTVLPSCLFIFPLLAEEAVLNDGRAVQGKLTLLESGRLRFIAKEKEFALEDVRQLRFPGQAMPFLAGIVHEVVLPREQRLRGEIQELNAELLDLRTSWAQRLQVPRRALVSLNHPSDCAAFHDEDFENDLKSWKMTGAPAFSERQQTSGRRSLKLDAPGQVAEFALPSPLEAGRVGIHFHDPGSGRGVRCFLEAEFAAEKGPRTLKIVLAGKGKEYQMESPLAAEEADPLARTAGWHRLSLRFTPSYLLVGVDDVLLWSSAKQGPGGPLRKLRLVVSEGPDAGSGEVFFDDLTLARFVEQRASRVEDQQQDELWLLSGDQLFGSVVRADRRSIELDARFGKRTLPWGEVRGIFFKQAEPPKNRKAEDGEWVRIGFYTGCGKLLDELEGTVTTLDDEHLTLRHADLGELKIERARLRHLLRAVKQ